MRALAAFTFFIVSCGTSTPPAAPPPDPLALSVPEDLDPNPNILEVNLEARPATKQFGAFPVSNVWTYDGTIPGPLLDAKVGDRLVVHFKNSLPEETTIHWHGVRVPAAMDGTVVAMQSPVQPGGSFEYTFTLRDAGLFWFHPHVRTDVQVEKGLAGVIRVRGPNEPTVDEERILVLDDVRLKDDGTFPAYLDDNSKMLGREGNTILVNGMTDAVIPVRSGSLVRWRILNTGNGRYFNLKLPGHVFHVIGADGGFVPQPWDTDRLMVIPGERYDVTFVAGPPGDVIMTSEPYERGHNTGQRPPIQVATVHITGPTIAGTTRNDPVVSSTPLTDGPPDIPLVFDEKVMANGDVLFTINGEGYPNVPIVNVPKGATRVVEVRNDSEMDHPFHLHGFFFQVVSRNGTAVVTSTYADDTVNVPMMSTLHLAAVFDEPGKWMYHCHINEHAEGGMMGELDVQ